MLDEAKDEEPVVTPATPIPAQAPITKTNVASTKKGAKRKAAADDSPAVTPAAKQAKISTPVASKQPKISTPVTKISKTSTPIVAATPPSTPGGTPAEEKTSRSGRVIKPKKFEDEKETLNQKEKMRWMKMEKRIVDLDIAIRSALHHEEPDMTRSISLISELQQLAIQPLMLKKIPNIVMTLRKVRKYIGPVTPHPDPQVCTEISTTYLTLIGMSYESKKNARL